MAGSVVYFNQNFEQDGALFQNLKLGDTEYTINSQVQLFFPLQGEWLKFLIPLYLSAGHSTLTMNLL
jgi:hypothetical protein